MQRAILSSFLSRSFSHPTLILLRPLRAFTTTHATLTSNHPITHEAPTTPRDPYPSLSVRHAPDSTLTDPYPNLPPIPRPNEDPVVTRARLLYQSRKRGMLENDLLLSTFARERLANMTDAQVKEYDALLDEPDWDIYYWAIGKKEVPEKWERSEVFGMLKEHVKNRGKVVLRMPDL
ncbi:Flavinator of succinate dehydrogenase-domain-containing protein [Jimgerdemannia flammicorona]|uniref:Succinate dehydrogenase assembly factor 2, mitochondrial n=1 Tax=Jimgerdemannia flammicorona TaxID=994334 RepID=A0A433R023_9FUNG|nr:Flavinator of succinate dehydrogenase-domain-containing protein [Jimgerdemannia flammicorona]